MPPRKPAPRPRAAGAREFRFASRVERLSGSMPMHYLRIPAATFKRMGSTFRLRLRASGNGGPEFPCAPMSLGDGKACIFLSAAKLKGMGAKLGSQVRVTARIDRSRYGMKLPGELAELLKQDAEARRRFDGISPGKQRNLIHLVANVKSPEGRVNRAFALLEALKGEPEGKETIHEIYRKARALWSAGPAGEPVPAPKGAGDDEDFFSKFLPASAAGEKDGAGG